MPSSPANKEVPPSASATIRVTSSSSNRSRSPGNSPRTIKPAAQSTPESTQPKPTARPLSLNLSPAQVKPTADTKPRIPTEKEAETEQKTVMAHNGIAQRYHLRETQSAGIFHNGKQVVPRVTETKEKGTVKKLSDSDEPMGMKVTTISGENKDVFMKVIESPKKQVGGSTNYISKNGSGSSSSGESDEGTPKAKKEKTGHKEKAKNGVPIGAFMNSNVQGVNNSIMYDSFCTHHDPGVHVALLRKPAADGFHPKDDPSSGLLN